MMLMTTVMMSLQVISADVGDGWDDGDVDWDTVDM